MGFRNPLTQLSAEQLAALRVQATTYPTGSLDEAEPARLSWGVLPGLITEPLFLQIRGASFDLGDAIFRPGPSITLRNSGTQTRVTVVATEIVLDGTVHGLDQAAYDFPRGIATDSDPFPALVATGLVYGTVPDAPAGTYRLECALVLRDTGAVTAGGEVDIIANAVVVRTGTVSTGPSSGLHSFITLSAPYVHAGGDLELTCEVTIGAGAPRVFNRGSYLTAYGPPQ